MFTNEERQNRRMGKYGTPRLQYLQDLVNQFQQESTNEELKERIVGHLANFAYDPYNYKHFRSLNVLELFLDCITEPNEKLIEYGLAGICNCCPDPANASIIVENGGIPLVRSCLTSSVANTVLSSIATLYFLCTPTTKKEILTPQVIECINQYAVAGPVANVRLQNLASAFLDKHARSM